MRAYLTHFRGHEPLAPLGISPASKTWIGQNFYSQPAICVNGRVNRKELPWPKVESTHMVPPWASMIDFAMQRPKPPQSYELGGFEMCVGFLALIL